MCPQKLRTETFDVVDMDGPPQVCQLEESAAQESPDFASYGVEGEEEDSSEDNCLFAGKLVGIVVAADVVRGFEGFGFVERGIGLYWMRMACAGTVTGHCTIVLESANHLEELELAAEEEVDLDRYLCMQRGKHRGQSVRDSPERGVCLLVKLAEEDGGTLETLALGALV